MAHWEMIGTMIYQCMRGASLEEIEAAGLIGYYTIHGRGVYPADPNGVPFMASYIQCTGDPIADLVEDLAADAAIIQEQHGRKRGTSLLHIKKGAEKLLF
ncbi:MAG: manganese catalase family protein, partial [Clostridia bacterium]|nr:manganese catalase family protein [Clostridia bacterium]